MKVFVKLLLIVAGSLLPLLMLEAYNRIDQRIRKGIPLALNPSSKWDAEQANLKEIDTVESDVGKSGYGYPDFRKAVEVTQTILKSLKALPGAQNLAFILVDDMEPYSTAFKDLVKEIGAPLFIAPRTVKFSPEMRLEDGTHLNEKGNKFMGAAFLNFLEQHKISPFSS